MKILLVDGESDDSPDGGAWSYVAHLGPALAESHRVSIVGVNPSPAHLFAAASAIRKASHGADVVHLNHLSGLALGAAIWSIPASMPVALTLHDDRLLSFPRAFNRWLADRVQLAFSPSRHLLERHLREGFFRLAIAEILPYPIEAVEAATTLEPFLYPASRPEAFPMALVEAMAAGRPVVATRVGAVPEVVRHEVNGLLVDSGDEVAINAALDRIRAFPDLAARLGASARETGRLYHYQYHLRGLEEGYRRLINARRGGDFERPAA